ncbi:MAG TPA: hypothetical protein VEA80_10615 [Vitreimonas sp.]|nr:hypothetical protein [Vitreimonas sp.]
MFADVHSRQVRDESLIAIAIDIEDETTLLPLRVFSELLRAQEDAKLQGHVEPWQPVLRIEFGSGEIVNAKPALADNAIQLLDAGLTGVFEFKRRSRSKLARENREDQRIKNGLVVFIERAIDEHIVRRRGRRTRHAFFWASTVRVTSRILC